MNMPVVERKSGPLTGLRVIELAGIGPSPHACMVLSDLGADVIRVVAPGKGQRESAGDPFTLRGRSTVIVDLKDTVQRDRVLELASRSDVVIEGFRPGVAERLGLGPADIRARNVSVVYGRVTGWGQAGPLAQSAGHDINYLAITGALAAIGLEGAPVPPLNLVGDYGGGSLYLLVGVLAALWERERSHQGQVVDAAMVDGVANMLQLILSHVATGSWSEERESNALDGGAPFYRTYRCSDGRHVAVGAIEPKFYALLLAGLGLLADVLPDRDDREEWPQLARIIGTRFAEQPLAHWRTVFDGTDACVTPVLTFSEAVEEAHIRARGSLIKRDKGVVAAPAPRFSRTQGVPGSSHASVLDLAEANLRWPLQETLRSDQYKVQSKEK